jgi:hypothetical protein
LQYCETDGSNNVAASLRGSVKECDVQNVSPLTTLFLLIIYEKPVCTSQETHYVYAAEPKRLVLFRETVAVHCEIHMEHTDTLCGFSFSKLKQLGHILTTWI